VAAAGGALVVAVAAAAGVQGDPDRGARVFQRCQACHAVRAGERGLPGPSLVGLWGRPAGTVPDFEYSPALGQAARRRALVWTETTLDAFLADPAGYLPGNWMAGAPVADPTERADLLAYLWWVTR
jgi:cytochrome c